MSATSYCTDSFASSSLLAPALNGIDMLKLGIPEGQEMAWALEAFSRAIEGSKEVACYLTACSGESLDCCPG
jgi:hypothetical protein